MHELQVIRRGLRVVAGKAGSVAAARPARRMLASRPQQPPADSPFTVYFGDGPAGLYQLQQWLGPWERLAAEVAPLTLLLTDPRTARDIAARTTLPVALVPGSASFEHFLAGHGVRVVFYVNNNQANFTALRVNGPAHVHLSHGESEKSSMVSNQLKAYDFAFVAGQASHERIMAAVPRFEERHLVHIGRPQLGFPGTPGFPPAPGITTVLYAPTWEGDSPAMAYSSLKTHGARLEDLLADPGVRVVLRPHPKTGSVDPSFHRTLAGLRSSLRRANAGRGAAAAHAYDTGTEPLASLAAADVVLADISAMAMDAVGLGRPTALCVNGDRPGQAPDALTLEGALPAWYRHEPEDLRSAVAALAAAPVPAAQESFRRHVFGDDGGDPCGRFLAAARDLIAG
ncbi:hypothetical protein NCCP1664_04210 [Zafaria cholistanensis]|uniref:CDP-glycerol:poly(Glycerophosphate) glycerophosphotransferase n=1 Tax=Zafaria cholistanensis TaxID=1682741 RepID=A0A5A7NLV4_9MICC|nr:CDP-glycerol--glycerophosphate glycerophosphotransferase [Zafaria cholistanensis]GER21924.1 hypothetical protein NCCP1664_04210 [Zafaria cholistanensis]